MTPTNPNEETYICDQCKQPVISTHQLICGSESLHFVPCSELIALREENAELKTLEQAACDTIRTLNIGKIIYCKSCESLRVERDRLVLAIANAGMLIRFKEDGSLYITLPPMHSGWPHECDESCPVFATTKEIEAARKTTI